MVEKTFLGPFATQAGQATPRQQTSPGFVPTRTGDTSPTIGLPGQDPIDSQSRRGDFIEKEIQPFDPEKERLKRELEKAKEVQTNIDPTIASGPIDYDAAIAGGARANMSEAQVLASSPAFIQTLEGYDPSDPFYTEAGSDIQKVMGTVARKVAGTGLLKTGVGVGSGFGIIKTGVTSALNFFDKRGTDEEEITTSPLTTSSNRLSRIGYRSTFDSQVAAAAPASISNVGAELFGNDPTYAGGNKTGADGLYATGGSGSFTSIAHLNAGISQRDESNIVAQGINSKSFNSAEEGRQTIDALVANGHSQDIVEAVAENKITVEEINQLGAATGAKESVDPGVDAPKVICAELYRQGLLEKEIFELDEEFGRHLRKVDPDIINGYHQWALPLVSLMQRSIVASYIIKIIAKPVVKHIAYQMGYPSKTYLGAAMFTVGKHICKFIAKKDVAHA